MLSWETHNSFIIYKYIYKVEAVCVVCEHHVCEAQMVS